MKPSLLPCALWVLIAVPAIAQQRPSAVEVTPAELRQLAPSVTATGQVQSRSGAGIAAAVDGQLRWVAEPGTRLAEGEVLARIDDDALRLQRLEQSARVSRSEVALKQAQRELERLRASGNAVSRYQFDQAENLRDLAAADLDIARATLRQTDERLSRTVIRAPFPGVVAERLRRGGEELARGDVIARLHDTEHLEIRLFLSLRHVRAIQPGSRVTIRSGENVAEARVRAVVPVGDARSQSFETLIDMPEHSRLAVGDTVRVELPLDAARQALAVPRDAIVIRSEGAAVYRIKADKTAERVPVTTGVAAGDWVAVEGELSVADPVVVRGAETLHHGDPVTVIGTRNV